MFSSISGVGSAAQPPPSFPRFEYGDDGMGTLALVDGRTRGNGSKKSRSNVQARAEENVEYKDVHVLLLTGVRTFVCAGSIQCNGQGYFSLYTIVVKMRR